MSARCDSCRRLFAPSERGPVDCLGCARAEVAALTRRIRLARDVVKSPAFVERGWYRKELDDLLDLRKPLKRGDK